MTEKKHVGDLFVKKRDGSLEPLDFDKIHAMLEQCSDGLNVSVSDTAINAHLKLVNKISSVDIQETLVKSASEKISPESPDYDVYAGRLLMTNMRKEVYGSHLPIPFLDYVKGNVKRGLYDPEILNAYSEDEIANLGEFINYENDWERGYASIVQLSAKYLLHDVKTDIMLEMPQETFMLIPMVMFAKEPKNRMRLVLDFYHALKDDEISLPTPIIAGVRTQLKMFSSCCKIKMGDSTESILASQYALSMMTANRAGIGVDMGPVRGMLAPVKGATVKHTGALPILKAVEATSKQFTQNTLRSGATVVNYPIFNWEIMDILEYKNNQGSNTTRARFIDYTVGIPSVFIDRLMAKEDFTLFSADDVPELFEHYGESTFTEIYEKYEHKRGIRKTVLPASEIFNKLVKERVGTGRIYIHFIDNMNQQGMFSEPITQTNLCSEIFLPTRPMTFDGLKKTRFTDINDYDLDDGMISLCILGCINFGKLSSITRLDALTSIFVRFLDNLIDEQEYPMDAAEWTTKAYRYLGIGISDFAHFLAKNEARLGTVKAKELTHKWAERFQYGLIKASNELAIERGPCEAFWNKSEYAKGKLPIDTYNKNVDSIVDNNLLCDWESLRVSIAEHGMRNMALSAIPPTASSSIVSNSTQGIDPIQSMTDTFESSAYTVRSLVPDSDKEKYYMKAWDFPDNTNSEYIKLMAVIQKFIDQGMSVNQWYDLTKIPGKVLDSNRVKRDIITAYKYGLKSLYYIRSKDRENITGDVAGIKEESCEGGACSI
jgi:ribonucleoside-diphosphate reductase alpha chain